MPSNKKEDTYLFKKVFDKDEMYSMNDLAKITGYTYEGAKNFVNKLGILRRHKIIGLYVLKKEFDTAMDKIKQEVKE